MSFSKRAPRWFVALVLAQLDDALSERRGAIERAGGAAAGMSSSVDALASAVRTAEDAVEARRPFSGTTTVHRAWARHPGARGVFARYHLTACPDCPVGADETLEEAARGYRISLETLLSQLNALL